MAKAAANSQITGPSGSYSHIRLSGDRKLDAEAERRRQMQEMKARYLSNPTKKRSSKEAHLEKGNVPYKDRAAVRRAAFGSSDTVVPPRTRPSGSPPLQRRSTSPVARATTQQAIDRSNVGYQMLARMEGDPIKMQAPLEVKTPQGRAGLGSKPMRGLDDLASSSWRSRGLSGSSTSYKDQTEVSMRRYQASGGPPSREP
ncbi:hypothetical protein K437DRAFT_85582 [Tilletiaria anomala UBC 951]|uniref:Uncharacterized protein n=1 Tax=Tilletiaria anomala (strain ATCC 24038 / CBS 436.72 / UBC 951) TaxID=1037660 RepID=A0A066WBI0_TILAU|nr:uncharacterized protein K437DRAFT_85582 [Tilletiaria anomala UBC 951]KDN48434.1 hypothetical protein K437DRAFT_85582 [Tilletiaria anomala UBC 951]